MGKTEVAYRIDTNTNDLGLTNYDDPSTADELYNHIKGKLDVGTTVNNSSSSSLSTFTKAFKNAAISLAISMNLNVTQISQSFDDLSVAAAVVSPTYIVTEFRSPQPTGTPTTFVKNSSSGSDNNVVLIATLVPVAILVLVAIVMGKSRFDKMFRYKVSVEN